MLETVAQWFVTVGLVAFLTASAWAPFETLAWWAGQHTSTKERRAQDRRPASAALRHFVVYLGGIDSISGVEHTGYERPFLEALERHLDPGALQTVFPYAANGEPLLRGPRLFRGIWRALQALPGKKRPLLAYLINARNAFQLLVAADRRYGPIFGQALAKLVLDALAGAGWTSNASQLTLIGYSGGAQMAISAAPYLTSRFKGGVRIISIGGTIISTRGLDFIDAFDHLTGSADLATRAAALMCGSRWPIALNSSWKRAQSDGRLVLTNLGPIAHTGPNGYFGDAKSPGHAQTNLEVSSAATFIALSRALQRRAPRTRHTLPARNHNAPAHNDLAG